MIKDFAIIFFVAGIICILWSFWVIRDEPSDTKKRIFRFLSICLTALAIILYVLA